MYFIAGQKEILEGKVSDIYFLRSQEILKEKGLDPSVKAEISIKSLPKGYGWGVLSGIEESLTLLSSIDSINVRCMPEGSIFFSDEPVMVIEGRYSAFGLFETALLGFLCHSSAVATKAARCKLSAGTRVVFNFGARRAHPAIAPMIERSAYIGGLDGVSTVAGAQYIGHDPIGTIPHALILIMGSTVEATRAFDEVIDGRVKRISLIDTFNDEKFEALNVCENLGRKLYGIRLDTPSSRRGSFKKIIQEVRWELDIRGFKDVKIVVSGGLDEDDITELCDIVDAYGIGTAISSAKVFDFSMDIVEIEGKKTAKRGKKSGAKKVLRCPECFGDLVVLQDDEEDHYCGKCSNMYEDTFMDAIIRGRLDHKFPPPDKIRDFVISQFKHLRGGGVVL
jgi:nicotinate phosphoribosyltransferase